MKKVNIFITAVLLLPVLSGCVANTFGLSEEEQIKAIEKYPRSGLNLQPDDGFFMTTGKVVARTFLCPLTLAISEGVLLNERNLSFSSYAIDLHNQRQMQQVKDYYDSLLGKNESAVLLKLGEPVDKKNLENGMTVLYFSNKIKSTSTFQLETPMMNLNVVGSNKLIRYKNDVKGNFESEIPQHSNNHHDYIYIDATGKCFAWDVIRKKAGSVFVINGDVSFI